MECFIVDPGDIRRQEQLLLLRGDEARHAARSLRMRVGEPLLATDLEGMCYRARITAIEESGKHELTVFASIDETLPEHGEADRDVELVQCLLNQPSKFEEIIERCTEMGVRTFAPVISERVERHNFKVERIERLLRTSCKQAHRARLPLLRGVRSLEQALGAATTDGRAIVLLHEAAPPEQTLRSVLADAGGAPLSILIGPEGGFSDDEVALATRSGAAVASLGPRRLRAETAAFTAIAIALS